ncbi:MULTISPECIES: hypothetical protein [unclassified Luteimonas]|uniref:DUF6998 domain-containing protein n=1 Tax=unclassified Luteimonas TaxID=2629088 RepID=UPI0018F0BEC3|nr:MULTISPECIES: hypothetical protein [unclassified Luteimonas]MBJ6981958.1 hypothetical protein [Luteimonas sp. MC1572]MBJ7576261.1 hypothetical protein [Luteimonas sp. MC1828]QQO03259.1 hypothetical protein JGR64_00285 [Luteimonas sp. MC1572]
MPQRRAITEALELIFQGIDHLKDAFPNRVFTIDGRLVGDIGEVIAALEYDMEVHDVSQAKHDGMTPDGRLVQVKATFKDSLTFKSTPELYLGFKLHPDGTYEEIYNGPGQAIYDRYSHRKGIGESLMSFPLTELRKLSDTVNAGQRVARRAG